MHKVPNRAYRSIERDKSRLQGPIRIGQKVSVVTGVKRKPWHGPVEETYRLFCLYTANPGVTQLSQTGT